MTPDQRRIISEIRKTVEERRALGHNDENIAHSLAVTEGWGWPAVNQAMEVK